MDNIPDESKVSITYDLAHVFGRMMSANAGHMADLAQALNAIKKGTFKDDAEPDPSAFFKVVYETVDVLASAEQRQVLKCFKAVVAEFLSFMDSIVAIQRIKITGISISRPLQGEQEILAYAMEYLVLATNEVATDRSLTAPKKISLCGLAGDSELEANAYVHLRNAIEHHGGIPTKDITLTLKALQLITTSGIVITGPMTLNSGEGINLRLEANQRVFEKGGQVTLTPDEMRKATFTIENFAREVVEKESVSSPGQRP